MAEVEKRVMGALTRLVCQHRGEAVAAVSHEVPIRLALAKIRGDDGAALWDFDLPTGSITHLEDLNGHLRLAGGPPLDDALQCRIPGSGRAGTAADLLPLDAAADRSFHSRFEPPIGGAWVPEHLTTPGRTWLVRRALADPPSMTVDWVFVNAEIVHE